MKDLLIVSFDNNDRNNEANLFVTRKHPNGDATVLNMKVDEQARILYKLLTDQSTFAEIKSRK